MFHWNYDKRCLVLDPFDFIERKTLLSINRLKLVLRHSDRSRRAEPAIHINPLRAN